MYNIAPYALVIMFLLFTIFTFCLNMSFFPSIQQYYTIGPGVKWRYIYFFVNKVYLFLCKHINKRFCDVCKSLSKHWLTPSHIRSLYSIIGHIIVLKRVIAKFLSLNILNLFNK